MADVALQNRVSALEQEVEGEKLVTRHILEQTRRNGDDLAAVRTQLGRVEQRQERAESEIRAVRTELGALRKDLPTIVAETMRDVMRERGRDA